MAIYNRKLKGSVLILVLPLLLLMMSLYEIGQAQFYFVKVNNQFEQIVQKRILKASIDHAYRPFAKDLYFADTCNEPITEKMNIIRNENKQVWVYRCYDSENQTIKINYGSN